MSSGVNRPCQGIAPNMIKKKITGIKINKNRFRCSFVHLRTLGEPNSKNATALYQLL